MPALLVTFGGCPKIAGLLGISFGITKMEMGDGGEKNYSGMKRKLTL